ncbi:protein kinase [Pontibacter qinzhouensis]|uniref:Protein kinase n=1 Tax=Pontibacter qinzhouensis TaxID=2603253 RepID=A0A5C8IJ62_9BACT|nr:leucine-rich repeat-containing protein kinase family protein [Pontibacter qinzhouensis]TXK20976.1 protein kinase [Pontibacter qinzhouensis]
MQTLEQLRSGQLAGTTSLRLLSCGLTEFPEEIIDLADTLEMLDLSGNPISQLPDSFKLLRNLKIAFFYNNEFEHFPPVLSECPKLEMIGFKENKISAIAEDAIPLNIRWLILTNNRLTQLPASIGKCRRLQKFMLAGNQLRTLPEEMAQCRNIELLRIAANQLETLPAWLFELPRLSWLAYSGNPCCESELPEKELTEINWADLALDVQLGQGASGYIYKAHWHRNKPAEIQEHVAVKVFKGEITSDGSPEDELKACMAAGNHPNFVQVLGRIGGHPEQKQGLVLSLIPPSYKNLGLPPSLESCTRDVYLEGTRFSLQTALSIATGIASAAAHLHAQHLLHGDLYAHNILINAAAHPLLGDFGAATSYTSVNKTWAQALERMEVRAFGCLLDDLLTHLAPADKTQTAVGLLSRLQEQCLQETIINRPGFVQVLQQLQEAAIRVTQKVEQA